MNFAQPGWLALLLLLPLIATGAALTARTRSKQWAVFVAGRLRPKLLRRSSPIPRWIAFACLLLSIACLIVALARPQAERGRTTDAIFGRNILIALDLSRSMKVADIKPDRLTQAKTTAFELVEALPNDRIGVVGFAGRPFLFAPLTVDHAAVRETITQIDIDWIPTGGSNLEGGLELAIETLKETGTRQNALILMSDGEEHSGRIADLAEEARAAGIEVISIGFGTKEGDFVPDPTIADGRFRDRQGDVVISRLEPEPLERVASITGGRFAIATSGADIPAMVETAVADLERVQVAGRQRTIKVEYYQWFLLPAILLLIGAVVAATQWRGVGLATAALFCLALQPVKAATLDDARKAMDEERFEDARQLYESLALRHQDTEKGFRFSLAQATAAYREGNWAIARQAFSEALRSDDTRVREAAHHGLGNTLFEIGWERLSDGPRYPETGTPPATDGDDEDAPRGAFDRLSDGLLGRDRDDRPRIPKEELREFSAMVKARLAEWLAEKPDSGQTDGARLFDELLTDWIDAVKHFDSAAGFERSEHNRDLTVMHLKKVREILDQLEQNAQQLQALPQPGEGPPQEGQPGEEPGEEGEESGEDGQQGEGGDEPQDGDGRTDGEERDGEGGEQEEQEAETDGKEDESITEPKPGETEEEAAKRILNENADLQKGALSPGRIRFERPEKDW